MSSYPKCIPPAPPSSAPQSVVIPAPWNEHSAFRETVLRHFTRPEDRACLARLGELLAESALEQAHLWPPFSGSETASGLAAACRDLEHTAHFLTSLSQARHLSSLPPTEQTLATLAATTARRLHHDLARLTEALARSADAGDGRVN